MLTAKLAGETPAGGDYPVPTVVISDNWEGDRSVESSEVKVSVGRRATQQVVAMVNQ
jgi:hypothetical protein